MGLLLSGDVNGEMYDKKRVSADQVMEIFGIKELFNVDPMDKNPIVELKLHNGKIKMKDGQQFHPSYQVPGSLMGTFKGADVELVYFDTMRKDRDDLITTTPRLLPFDKRSIKFRFLQKKELVVWYILHPYCAESPLRNDNHDLVWTLDDSRKESEHFYRAAMKEGEIRKQILEDAITVVKRKAMGMRLVSPKATEYEARAKLIGRFDALKSQGKLAEFYNDWEEPYSHVSGLVKEAVDRGVIKKVDMKSGGRVAWIWGENLPQSGAIREVGRGLDPLEELIKHVTSNYHPLVNQLDNAVKGRKDHRDLGFKVQLVEEKYAIEDMLGKVAVPDMEIHELVKVAKYNDIIGYNRETKSVHFINRKDGGFLKEKIFSPEKYKHWVTESTEFFVKGHNMDSLNTLRSKLAAVAGHMAGDGDDSESDE